MDQETRLVLAALVDQVRDVARVASNALATALTLQMTVCGSSSALETAFLEHDGSREVAEIRLQAEHLQVTLRQVTEKLRA